MRAVRTNTFVWAAVIVIIGLEPRWALAAAIVGFLLAVVPALTAPKVVPVRNNEHGQHAGTLYELHHPAAGRMPRNPLPGDHPHDRR